MLNITFIEGLKEKILGESFDINFNSEKALLRSLLPTQLTYEIKTEITRLIEILVKFQPDSFQKKENLKNEFNQWYLRNTGDEGAIHQINVALSNRAPDAL